MVVDIELKDIVIESLRWGAKHTRQIADEIGFTIAQISSTIGYLKKKGVVEVARREGRTTYYKLAPKLSNVRRHKLAESIIFLCNQNGLVLTDVVKCLSHCKKTDDCTRLRKVWKEWGELVCIPREDG